MPRAKKVKEEASPWAEMGPEAWSNKMKEKHMGMMPGMMWKMKGCGCGCFGHRGHKLGAFILAVSVMCMLNMMGTIPAYIPWWLELLIALSFAMTFG
jgi:hypothetical protein